MGLYILNGFQLKTSRPGRELRGWLPLPCSTSPRHRARPRGARRVRADRLGRADPRSLCLGGGAAPHGHRQRACACARRAVRPGDGEEPQYRAAGLGADLWAAGRGPEPRPGLEPPPGRPGARRSRTTCCSASSTAKCRTGRASSPPYTRRDSPCRGAG